MGLLTVLAIAVAGYAVFLRMPGLADLLVSYVEPQLLQFEGWGVDKFERGEIPDWFSRAGTRFALQKRLDKQIKEAGAEGSESEREYLTHWHEDLKTRPIAVQTAEANEQHYEVDTEFYNLVLGPKHKYSSALYPSADTARSEASAGLDEAEVRMLELYAERAQITKDSKLRVMDLGCGWGSVTLWFAQTFPNCEFVGLSNSQTQREYILSTAQERGLTNVDVITGDITVLQLPETVASFDRVISIEMFEHMKNYQQLLRKVSTFLKPEGMLFVHIFVARNMPFHFLVDNTPTDWMARYFFSGGTMPADDTLPYFQDDFKLNKRWRVNGKHYSLTLEAWLQRMDAQETEVRAVLAKSYGADNEELWWNRWRAFFFVCSELFNFDDGNEWYVAHYLFQKRA